MRRLIIILGWISLSIVHAHAIDYSGSKPTVTATVQREPINTVVPIFRAFLNVGPDKFTFLVPETFRMGSETAQGKLKLISMEGDVLITLTFLDPSQSNSPDLVPDGYRELLAQRYPAGKFLGEFSRPVAGRKAVGFDVEWKGSSGLAQTTRTVYVPSVAGVIELTVTSGTKKFRDAQSNFNEVLGSLTAGKDGKLVFHHLEEKS